MSSPNFPLVKPLSFILLNKYDLSHTRAQAQT